MKTFNGRLGLSVVLLFLLWVSAASAGSLLYQYKSEMTGKVYDIKNVEDVDQYIDADDALSRSIFGQYFADSSDTEAIRQHVAPLTYDVTVVVNGQGGGSYCSGKAVNIDHNDEFRAMATLAHETAHSVMYGNYGERWPPLAYGPDGNHYLDELTTPSSAWVEGYAEYWGAYAGSGQEPIGDIQDFDFKREVEGTTWGDTPETAWENIADPNDMWSSEVLNAAMLKDMAENMPDGAAKIEQLIQDGGYTATFKDFLTAWVAKYPEDTLKLAVVVDADTDFTMAESDLKDLLGNGAPYYLGSIRGNLQKGKGLNPEKLISEGLEQVPSVKIATLKDQQNELQKKVNRWKSWRWLPFVGGRVRNWESQINEIQRQIKELESVVQTLSSPSVSSVPGVDKAGVPGNELPAASYQDDSATGRKATEEGASAGRKAAEESATNGRKAILGK